MKNKLFLIEILFAICLFLSSDIDPARANVSITSATGGTNISSDKAQNGPSSGFTTLGNIVISESAVTDFGANQTNKTLVLTTPSGWSFNTGVGTVSHSGISPSTADIVSESISVTSTKATITFSTENNGNGIRLDNLTISGLQVRADNGSTIPSSGNILRSSSDPGNGVITGITNDSTNFGSLSQAVGSVSVATSTVSVSSSSIQADDTTTSTITVTLKDHFGSPVSGKTVSLTKSSGPGTPTITTVSGITNSSGIATFTVRSSTAGEDTFQATDVTDSLTITQTVNVIFLSSSQTSVPSGGGTVTITSTQTEVVVYSSTDAATISIPSTVNNATLNLDSLIDNTNGTGVLPNISINSATSIGNVDVEIPASTSVNAGGAWDGILNAPSVRSNSSVSLQSNNTVNAVVEIGFGNTALTFNKAIRMKFANYAGKKTGYSRNSVFTEITSTCSADSQTVGDALAAGGDCKIDVGSDLIVWTKHFTSFVIFVQTAEASASSSSGGGSFVEILSKPTDYSIVINKGTKMTSDPNVTLNLKATLSPSFYNQTGDMIIDTVEDFLNSNKESFSETKQFNICYPKLTCPYGTYTVYAKFFSGWGQGSNIASTSIIYQSVLNNSTSTVQEIATTTPNIATTTPKFTRNLKRGIIGEDVRYLQVLLNRLGFIVASKGNGSPGKETAYFGYFTEQALIKYQEANADIILKPYELKKGTGILGKLTRSVFNNLR